MAVFVYFLVPETKGKTMAELQAMFEGWMTNPDLKVECPQNNDIEIICPLANYKNYCPSFVQNEEKTKKVARK